MHVLDGNENLLVLILVQMVAVLSSRVCDPRGQLCSDMCLPAYWSHLTDTTLTSSLVNFEHDCCLQDVKMRPGIVAHAYNLRRLGRRDQEDQGSRPAWARPPISSSKLGVLVHTSLHKRPLVGGCIRGWPWAKMGDPA